MSRETLQKQVAELLAEDAVTFTAVCPPPRCPKFPFADALLISLSDSPGFGADRARQAGQLYGRGRRCWLR